MIAKMSLSPSIGETGDARPRLDAMLTMTYRRDEDERARDRRPAGRFGRVRALLA